MVETATAVEVGLSAAIVTITNHQPMILCANNIAGDITSNPVSSLDQLDDTPPSLPFGRFDPLHHRTLESGLRQWVEEQTTLKLGYVEQLYTFGDRGRYKRDEDDGHVISIGYLALTRLPDISSPAAPIGAHSDWYHWYDFLPWEDWRNGKPAIIDQMIIPALRKWAKHDEQLPQADDTRPLPRLTRLRLAFGLDGIVWDDERALERYELLYEAQLVQEARLDSKDKTPVETYKQLALQHTGRVMAFDHRRILATAIARLRAKLKYRPVIFEVMPDCFTLTSLQETVEAISGRHLHKQNFRRLVETAELLEATGASLSQQRGRPAALYRFRRAVLEERPAPGLRVSLRTA